LNEKGRDSLSPGIMVFLFGGMVLNLFNARGCMRIPGDSGVAVVSGFLAPISVIQKPLLLLKAVDNRSNISFIIKKTLISKT
jgi:hypothetical protein